MIETALHPAESSEFLSRLHDGELGPAEAAAFEAHRADCADCRAAVAEFERVLSVYREAPVAPHASDLSARILRKIRQTAPSRRPFGVMFGIDLRWAGLLAAALLVVIIGAPVFSRRPLLEAPVEPAASAPIPAYVLDAEDLPARADELSAKARKPAERNAAAKPKAVEPMPESTLKTRNEAAGFAAPSIARENAEAKEDDARVAAAAPAAPAAAPAEAATLQAPAKDASGNLRARRQTASAPAGGEAGTAGVAEAAPEIRLTIRAIDGEGTAPELARTPSEEDLAPFRGQEFVLLVESGGRVRSVERHSADKKLDRDSASTAKQSGARPNDAAVVFRDLVFQPGDRSRRLTVTVQ